MFSIDFGHIGLTLICIGLLVSNYLERRHAYAQEEKLVMGILAGTAVEYSQASVTPKDRIKEWQAESAMAEKAYQLEKVTNPEGTERKPGERSFPVGA